MNPKADARPLRSVLFVAGSDPRTGVVKVGVERKGLGG